jgi:ribokinase
LKIAVIGHVEHVTIARVDTLPSVGSILHLDDHRWIAGGGGAIAFFQLAKSAGEIHFFTALGNDDAAGLVGERIAANEAQIHAAHRNEAQTRDIVLITPGGERTIMVIGQPLHPKRDDPLPWDILRGFDAAYFTAQDPRILQGARAAKLLVVTARRAEALRKSGVRADVVVGSARDPREVSVLADYRSAPKALVLTDGAKGGEIITASGTTRFESPQRATEPVGAYGAGDSFAGALTWYLACGLSIEEACAEAAVYGAAVLYGIDPIGAQTPLRNVISDAK